MRSERLMTLTLGATLSLSGLLAFASPATASAQDNVDLDALWDSYAEQSERFVELQTQCDEGNIQGATTNRSCRRAVDQGFELADTISVLVANDDSLSEDERAALLDGMFTTRQIATSIMVDLGDCEQAKPILEALLAQPEMADRPSVAEAAERWLANANQCITEQHALVEAETSPSSLVEQPEAAGRNVGPLLMTAGGGALLAAGAVLDVANQSSLRTLRDVRDNGEPCLDRCETALNRVKGTRVPIALLYGVGGATLVGGVVWMIVDRGSDSETAWQLQPHATRDGGENFYGISLGGRF